MRPLRGAAAVFLGVILASPLVSVQGFPARAQRFAVSSNFGCVVSSNTSQSSYSRWRASCRFVPQWRCQKVPSTVMYSNDPKEKYHHPSLGQVSQPSRRLVFRRLVLASLPFAPWGSVSNVASAACLPGDLSTSCIGVYKVPMDDKILPYTSTPEQLKKVAPDLRWVPPVEPPKTYKEAFEELSGPLRERCTTLKDVVLKGNLEEAGVDLLEIMPRVTACGRVIVGGLYKAAEKRKPSAGAPVEDYSMKAYRTSVALSDLEASLGSCDVLIGQGLRGDLGVSAPAQIQILAEIGEMNDLFTTLMGIIPAAVSIDSR